MAGGDRRSGRRASTALPLPASSPDPRCALTEVKGHPSVSGDREKRDFGGAAAYGARKPERAPAGEDSRLPNASPTSPKRPRPDRSPSWAPSSTALCPCEGAVGPAGRAGVTAPDTPAPLAGDWRRHRGSWCGGSSEIKTRKNQRPRKNKKIMCSLTAEEKGETGPTADGNRLRWPQSSGPTPARTRGTSGLTHSPPRLRPPLRCGCRGTDSARSRRL